LVIKPQIITNTQNVHQLNQCTLDTFRHERWQQFQSPGVTANVLTGIKNILIKCLVGAHSQI